MSGEKLRGVHIAGDGRGQRRVLLDGVEMSNVVYADTTRGVVRYIPQPIQIHKHGKRIIERTKRGKVEVYAL